MVLLASADSSEPLRAARAAFVDAFRCVGAGRAPTVYVSVPITTGPRFLDWWRSGGIGLERGGPAFTEGRARVVTDNVDAARTLTTRVRERFAGSVVIDPTYLGDVPGWDQDHYNAAWSEVVESFADTVVFASGWEYSVGCATEFVAAAGRGLRVLDEALQPLDADTALHLVDAAVRTLRREPGAPLTTGPLEGARARLTTLAAGPVDRDTFRADAAVGALKDDRLAAVASLHNVAQFVSFAPHTTEVRHVRMREWPGTTTDPRDLLAALLARANDGAVNVRSFVPGGPKSGPFVMGLDNVDDALRALHKVTEEGYHAIVNEAVDVNDGGMSGVAVGGFVEFAPQDTPRAVEKAGTAGLPLDLARRFFDVVYGAEPALGDQRSQRVEFSVHPRLVGLRHRNTLVWEVEDVGETDVSVPTTWPNRVSEFIGDKTFGLLVAHLHGLPVPRTTAVLRDVGPFSFGRATGTGQTWLRTTPRRQQPGLFPTTRTWEDPYKLVCDVADGHLLAGVLAQEGVDAAFSGATEQDAHGNIRVEGVRGYGDVFMSGESRPVGLTANVVADVSALALRARTAVGASNIEWAHDGRSAWLLQLHQSRGGLPNGVVSPGDASTWIPFDPRHGLEELRSLLGTIHGDVGVLITGPVGVTSHVGDLLRKAGIPARLTVADL